MRIRYAVAAAVGSIGLLAGLAVPALGAQNDVLSQTADGTTCGQVTLTFAVAEDAFAAYAWTYGKGNNDGTGNQNLGIVSVQPGESESVTVQLEDGQFASYGTFAGPENKKFLAHEAAVPASDCTEPAPEPSRQCEIADAFLDRLEERFPEREFQGLDDFYEQRCGERLDA